MVPAHFHAHPFWNTMVLPAWLDALLILPFRCPDSPRLGFWLGSSVLALICLILGEVTFALIFFLQRTLSSAQSNNHLDDLVRYHNLSVQAIHEGNKEAYLATNALAHEHFGRHFFAQAASGLASLWPLPFALAWLAQRFEGLTLYIIPHTSIALGYVFVLLTCYICERLLFGRIRRHLPLFGRIEAIRRAEREKRGKLQSF
ncbi:MAG: hypothetical protein K6G15_00525 [Desulfovibrio sp.]|nr:hypothetical protein [Desulfovibrio sp.]